MFDAGYLNGAWPDLHPIPTGDPVCAMRRQCLTAAAFAILGGWAPLTSAASFPDKPLVLLVPYPAGGASDVVARIFAQAMGPFLKQAVLVENLGGGTGQVAVQKLLGAPADGQMVLQGSVNEVLLVPLTNPLARYRPQDFRLVVAVSEAPIVLLVRQGLAVDRFDDWIALARNSQGNPLSYATVGNDSLYHLMGEALAARLGLHLLHVPYKGAAPALQDVAGGQIDCAILPYQSSFEAMASKGRLRILSSFSSSLPRFLAAVPLITESRICPDFVHSVAGGYFVRQATPPVAMATLRDAIHQALARPELRERLEQEGKTLLEPVSSQAECDQRFERMTQRMTALVQSVGRVAGR